ncbi:MAG: NrpR regulatory domain-containing protein [Methanobrevibacter sp.]|jgi:repressor of nif and glnA expression|nr:NrpR regulatory domain-containing protein [Methanobrevibacter sp.]
MSESQEKIIEILRILNEEDKAIGAKVIANELNNKGYNLGERAVRYHMKILDEKGFAERVGYSGRKITKLGQEELKKGLVYNQVDFIFSKFEEMIYQTDLDLKTAIGNVIVNTSKINLETTKYNKLEESMKEVFKAGLGVSPFIKIEKGKEKELFIKTICGTTIDGMLLSNGILTLPLYGGLLKIKNNIPQRFTELISYKKTSITPLDAFIADDVTSVVDVVKKGTGIIPANFRVIPYEGLEKAKEILDKASKIGINGVISIGKSGKSVLGIPVNEGMVGIAIVGGVAPLCAAKELGYDIDIKLSEKIAKFENLTPIINQKNNSNSYQNKILKGNTDSAKEFTKQKVPFLASKAWNLIQKVDFDIKSSQGNLIANMSYLDEEDLDEAIKIMKNSYKSLKDYMNPYYKIINNTETNNNIDSNNTNPNNTSFSNTDSNKIGIATICSLSIDGILINNGIISTPKYGGLLELGNNPQFVELISYNGSSIDPHEIFILKNMTSIKEKQNPTKILASVKEIPLIAKEKSHEILDNLSKMGFPIYKIGNPREIIYNAKVDSYNFGVVSGSGLNPIAAIKEEGIDVNIKAVQGTISFDEMETLN